MDRVSFKRLSMIQPGSWQQQLCVVNFLLEQTHTQETPSVHAVAIGRRQVALAANAKYELIHTSQVLGI